MVAEIDKHQATGCCGGWDSYGRQRYGERIGMRLWKRWLVVVAGLALIGVGIGVI